MIVLLPISTVCVSVFGGSATGLGDVFEAPQDERRRVEMNKKEKSFIEKKEL